MTTTTDTGVADTELSGLEDATNAFLASFTDQAGDEDAVKKQPSEKNDSKPTKEEEPTETSDDDEKTSDESPEETDADESSEETDEKPDAKKYVDDDNVYVKVKVGDQELEIPVKDLKKYAGQEAALTRKSQALAEQQKRVETDAQRYATGLSAITQRAEARANEFRKINFLALAKDPNVNAEQLSILQDEARKALEEEAFLKSELQTFSKTVEQQNTQQFQARAVATVKDLTDQASPNYIEGFNQKMYTDLLDFAVGEGIDREVAGQLVDAPVFKLLHMAMSFKKGASKVTTQKVNKTPKKIVKSSSSPVATNLKASKEKQAMAKLKADGSMENAQNAFLARLERHADD